jgi:co-chaperonin GroES (HSP10)
VVIELEEVEETSEGGIILHTATLEQERLAQLFGTVVAVGPEAWRTDEGHKNESYCDVGQRVLVRRYGWTRLNGTENDRLVIINDDGIIAKVFGDE